MKMLTETQKKILKFLLANPEEYLTIRGIAKKLKKSYTLVYNNIAKLEKQEILTKQNVPPSKIVSLNEFAPTEILVDIELERKKEFLDNHKWIKVMLDDILDSSKNIFFILLIFGSYARDNQTAKSDLDMLFILKDKNDMKDIEADVYTRVKKGLNFVDIDDFNEMIKDPNKLNIGNEARKYHIILYGAEQYHQLLKKWKTK